MKITNHTYTKENIIEQIYKYMEEHNSIFMPKTSDFTLSNNLPSYNTVVRLFGSFKNLSDNFIQKNSREGIILLLKKYIKDNKLVKLPTQKEIRAAKELPSPSTIKEYFSSMEEISLLLSIDSNKFVYTQEVLLNKLIEYKVKYKDITANRIENDYTMPALKTYINRFGSFKNACKLAGIKYNTKQNIISIGEKELLEFIRIITNKEVYSNDRTALENGKEIDIYIPDLDIGIEYNGNYWHSKKHKNKNYHINKTNRAKEFGITLIHIFESEWENNREEIEQYLRSIINKTTAQIYRGKNKLEIDNMKPMKYINIQVVEVKEPQLKTFGKHQCWDCGTTIYEVIK